MTLRQILKWRRIWTGEKIVKSELFANRPFIPNHTQLNERMRGGRRTSRAMLFHTAPKIDFLLDLKMFALSTKQSLPAAAARPPAAGGRGLAAALGAVLRGRGAKRCLMVTSM